MYIISPLGTRFMESNARDVVGTMFKYERIGKIGLYSLRSRNVQDLRGIIASPARRVLGIWKSYGIHQGMVFHE